MTVKNKCNLQIIGHGEKTNEIHSNSDTKFKKDARDRRQITKPEKAKTTSVI